MEFTYVLLSICGIVGQYMDLAEGKATRPPTTLPTTRHTTYPTARNTKRPLWIKEDYPNPQKDEELCHPDSPIPVKSFICDHNELVSQADVQYIRAMITKLSYGGDCLCNSRKCSIGQPGIKLALAAVKQIGGSSGGRGQSAAQDFANYLRTQSWKFAGPCGDDAVLVVTQIPKAAALSLGKDVALYFNEKNINLQNLLRLDPNIIDVGLEAKLIVEKLGKSLNVTVTDDDYKQKNIVAGDGIDTWTKVAAAGVGIGFIALLALSGALAAYCGRKCRGTEREREVRRVRRAEGRRPGFAFFGRRRRNENEGREVRNSRREKPRRERRPWFGRVSRKQRQQARNSDYHDYHGVNESIKEESEVRSPYYNESNGLDRRSGDYDSQRRSGSYRSDRNSGYFESGGSQRGEPAHIF